MKKNVKFRNLIIILSLIFVCVLTALVFCGCDGDDKKQEGNNSAKTENPPDEPKQDEPPVEEKTTYTLIYYTGEGGTVIGKKTQTVEEGENGSTIEAVSDAGYKFVQWSDGITTAERTDKNVKSNKTVMAIFEKLKFKVEYIASEGGTIDGKSEQEIEYGNETDFVAAVPENGYKFVRWSDGSGSTMRREENIKTDISLTAEFEFLYGGGDGSATNPFTIENYTQLNDMWYYPEANYKLVNDLYLNGIDHEPIFDDDTCFMGRFDGNNKTIKNLTLKSETNYLSLFGFIGPGSSVCYLNLIDADIVMTNYNTVLTGQNYYVGLLAGVSMGYVHDVTVSGNVTANGLYSDYVTVGGLVGMGYSTIAECTSDVQIEITDAQSKNSTDKPFVFGGLIGVANSAYIRECTANGAITVSDSCDYVLAGGLIGYYFTSEGVDTYIRDCETDVKIICEYAGGFIGEATVAVQSVLTINDCSAHGDMQANEVGGFVHQIFSYSELLIENCFTDNELMGIIVSGFIYNVYGNNNDINIIRLRNCCAIGKISTKYNAYGFCRQAHGVKITGCFADVEFLETSRYLFAFADKINYCDLEGCYARGNINATDMASGFARSLSYSVVTDCYSSCNLYWKAGGGSKYISNFGGLASRASDSEILNSYYSGKIYSETDDTVGSKTGILCGLIRNVKITNCHALNTEELSLEVIGKNENSEDLSIDVTSYKSLTDMYFIADLLNEGSDRGIWVNVENGCPELKL